MDRWRSHTACWFIPHRLRRDLPRLGRHEYSTTYIHTCICVCLYVSYVIFAILITIIMRRNNKKLAKQTKTATKQRHENYYTLKMGSHFQLRFVRIANALNVGDLVICCGWKANMWQIRRNMSWVSF